MGDYWIVAACAFYALAVFLPLFFLSPAAKARYLPVPFVAIAIGLPTLVIWGMELSPYFYVVILLMLINVRVIVSQARVCPQCGAISGLQRGAREVHHCPVAREEAKGRRKSHDVVPSTPSPGAPPHGYEVQTAPNGDLTIRYRTTGMGCMATFLGVFILGWTAGCVIATILLLRDDKADAHFIVPLLWLCNLWVIGHTVWLFFSRWQLVFSADGLAVTRSLGPIARRRRFARNEIRVVRLVQDGGDPDAPPGATGGVRAGSRRGGRRDSFPSSAVIISANQDVALFTRQGWEQAAWLSRFISDWSGAPYEDLGPAGDLKYKRL